MSLLVLDSVSKRFPRGARGREQLVLRGVSLEVASGDVVAVWGRRRSGRSTLLRVAGGIEPPSDGVVRFAGGDLRRSPMLGVPRGIGYCTTSFTRMLGETVVEHVAAPLLGHDVSVLQAEVRAYEALRRVGAERCAALDPDGLDHSEAVCVGIARALVAEPSCCWWTSRRADSTRPQPRRDPRAAALACGSERIAVLVTVDEATALAGADRALTLDGGELRGATASVTAAVVPLRRAEARG